MNIKNQICNLIKDLEEKFATPQDYTGDFAFLAKTFLQAENYEKMERYSRMTMRNAFMKHGKAQEIGGVIENLLNFELYFDFEYRPKQKLHFWHLTNVFLLGLYLYHNVNTIKKGFNDFIENDCQPVKLIVEDDDKLLLNKDWQYSSDGPFGEFLYRWRLASLCHDIGTPFSQVGKDDIKIKQMLNELGSVSTIKLRNINSFINFQSKFLNCSLKKTENRELAYNPNGWFENSKTIFSYLDDMIDTISLSKYVENQKINPYNQEIYYDHGIFSALLFIIIVNDNFRLYDNDRVYDFNKGIWHPYLFRKSLMHSAKAIAMHNLDQDDKSLALSLKNIDGNLKIYDFEKDPLSWLLKIADILQIWDKPTTQIINKKEKPEPTFFEIDFEGNDKIILRNIPYYEEIIEKIEKYTKSSIKFSIE